MTKPKTEEELQKRVLEVLRREWEGAHPDDDKDYRLVGTGRRHEGYVRPDGCAFGLIGDLGPPELAALAEASRLLRDGIEKPSRMDQALEVLRATGFPGAKVIEGRILSVNPYLSLVSPAPYSVETYGPLDLDAGDWHAIGQALTILNSEQP